MDILLRESLFGRLMNYSSNGKALPYPDCISLEKAASRGKLEHRTTQTKL